MNHRHRLATSTTAAAAIAALLLFSPAARAAAPGSDPLPTRSGEFSLKLEPGVTFPLTSPQSELFTAGGALSVKGLWAINRYLAAGPSVTFVALPAASAASAFGTAWGFGGSLVVRRPHDLPDGASFYNISPWADLDAMYVRTGPLNRPGLGVGAGLAVPIGEARIFWLGPFIRYFEIFQGTRAGYDNHDAKLLTIGLSLEVGPGVRREPERAAALPAEVRTEVRTVVQETVSCPDRDGDGVPDSVDRCPDVAGPWENHGCPPYQKLVVKSDKLELKEKLYFHWNEAVLEDASLPALDEVVQALKDNKNFKVQVEGHSSSEGGNDHNQDLSEQRARAVLDYLVSHGIARERLVSKGFSSSVPAASNDTPAGREQNRRVEFVVDFILLTDGSK
jgi:outer membrane protein OmpA-like peptidoglycan-associated protein